MKLGSCSRLLLAAVLLCCCAVTLVCGQPPLWPLPAFVNGGIGQLPISPASLSVVTPNTSLSLLQAAITRYQSLFFPYYTSQTGSKVVLTVQVRNSTQDLQLGVSENYTLTVPTSGNALLTADTVFGAMRGLETFSQLIVFNYKTSAYSITDLPITIEDYPRFPWRGLLVDSARHFVDFNTVLRTIDALSYSKMNTLHWHITDAQSFPMQSASVPLLAQKGAYLYPNATYSAAQVQQAIQYGLERGVRIVPEFDTPGHAASWGDAYPSIIANCPAMASNINNIPLNPSVNLTFTVLNNFLNDMINLFTDDYLHIGGDEVEYDCWLQDPSILAWMNQNNLPTGQAVEAYYEKKLFGIINNRKKTVGWEEIFDDGMPVPTSTIIQVWKDAQTLQLVIASGRKALQSFGWYLDRQIPDPPSTHYEWEDTWQDFYNNEPYANLTVPTSMLSNILGGEAAMWGEQVNGVNFDGRVWPRACAVGERLWSPRDVTSINIAIPRLMAHTCRLSLRGIRSGPIAPDYCPLP